MKKHILIFIFPLCSQYFAYTQNLIPNGDFEQNSGCNNITSILSAPPWFNPTGGTPDYFNVCATNFIFQVPLNDFGYQQPHSGAGYAGLIPYYDDLMFAREYMEVPLTTPLTANACYYFEMYVALSENYGRLTTDDIGAYFSTNMISGIPGYAILPYIAQVNNTSGVYPDTSEWTRVSGYFTAAGGESYLIVGNFKDNQNTDTLLYNSSIFWEQSYFFIDDVFLALCTGSNEEIAQTAITTYPNPFKDRLTINTNNNQPFSIALYDITSRKILQAEFTNSITLNTSLLPKGIYSYQVFSQPGILHNGKVTKEQ